MAMTKGAFFLDEVCCIPATRTGLRDAFPFMLDVQEGAVTLRCLMPLKELKHFL